MKRKCQECGAHSVSISLMGLEKRLTCSVCSVEYEMTAPQKWLISLLGALAFPLAIYTGILFSSWLSFIFFAFLVPLLIHVFVQYFAVLKLTGLKGALRAKGL